MAKLLLLLMFLFSPKTFAIDVEECEWVLRGMTGSERMELLLNHMITHPPEAPLKSGYLPPWAFRNVHKAIIGEFVSRHGTQVRAGANIVEVSKASGISKIELRAAMDGHVTLKLHSLVRLAQTYKVPIWELTGELSRFVLIANGWIRSPSKGSYSDFVGRTPESLPFGLLMAQSKHLKWVVERIGFRIPQLAAKMGVDLYYLESFIEGREELTMENALDLATALSVDPKIVLSFLEDFEGLQ